MGISLSSGVQKKIHSTSFTTHCRRRSKLNAAVTTLKLQLFPRTYHYRKCNPSKCQPSSSGSLYHTAVTNLWSSWIQQCNKENPL